VENELPCSERADAGKSMERIVAARGLWGKSEVTPRRQSVF